jgi:hypothetical protein
MLKANIDPPDFIACHTPSWAAESGRSDCIIINQCLLPNSSFTRASTRSAMVRKSWSLPSIRVGLGDEFHPRDFLCVLRYCFVLSAKIAINQRNMPERPASLVDGPGIRAVSVRS